jgi:hypothetical protein
MGAGAAALPSFGTLAGGASKGNAAPFDPTIRRSGNLLKRGGERFILSGVSQYILNREWQQPCEAYYVHRAAIYSKFVELGINAQRIGFWARSFAEPDGFLSQSIQRERIRNICSDAAKRGIYSIICLWDTLGQTSEADLAKSREVALPVLADLWRTPGIGDNPYVMLDPWNEPGIVANDIWYRHFTITIRALRAMGYKGVIFIDTPSWSWSFRRIESSGHADRLLALDDNICFGNHRYPQGDVTKGYEYVGDARRQHVEEVLQYVGKYPILGIEYGWHAHLNGPDGASQNHPVWMSQLLDHFVDIDIPAGLNGALLWKWNWIPDGLTVPENYSEEGMLTLSEYGQLANKHLWSRLKRKT